MLPMRCFRSRGNQQHHARAWRRPSLALGVAAFAGAASYASPAEFSEGFVAAMWVSTGLSVIAAMAGGVSLLSTI